jgi:hypothetical protein
MDLRTPREQANKFLRVVARACLQRVLARVDRPQLAAVVVRPLEVEDLDRQAEALLDIGVRGGELERCLVFHGGDAGH